MTLKSYKGKKPIISNYYIKPMTKELSFTISERVAISKILNEFKGTLTVLAILLDDIKKIAITPEEWEKAGLKKTPVLDAQGTPTGQENWNWNDGVEGLNKTVELNSETTLFLLNEIKAKEDKKEITMADISLITLKAKLV